MAASRKAAPPASGKRVRWIRLLLILGAILLLLPVLQVACVRWINPPVTVPMLLRRSEKDAATRPSQYEWRDLRDMPREFLVSVLVAEDQRFALHHGFDWREIRAAQKEAARTGKPPRGASTLTMQCARSLFLWQGRSYFRKALEVYYTFWMELLLPKSRIIELYGNVVELGNGVYGIGAAAKANYAKDASKLSPAECVRLAAVLPAPRQWSPKSPTPKYSARVSRIEQARVSARIPGIDKLLPRG